MTRLLTINAVKKIIDIVGIEACLLKLVNDLEEDFSRWNDFNKMPRIASHFAHGVIELMPIHNNDYYAYKYVNGHPANPKKNKLTVVAVGMLSEVESGYPILFSEMTLLTALRTAASCALAAKYLARANSKTVAMIGTGSQSEFQILALKGVLNIDTVHYFDIDHQAMNKFDHNLSSFDLALHECPDTETAVKGADIIVTATADKQRLKILQNDWIQPGVHINGVGGDCPGKTELDPEILKHAKIVVEYYEQSKYEGEIQNLKNHSVTELWQIIAGQQPGRESDQEITLFDSVGFALEDYTVLKYFFDLAERFNIGERVDMVPIVQDPKDLFGFIKYPG